MDINFDDFVERFYANNTGEKMAFQLTIEDDDDTTLYDIHEMLLELFLKGLYLNNLPISDPSSLLRSLNQIQTYFNNIQVKINIKTYSIKELMSDSVGYLNRYLRIMPGSDFLKNGQHNSDNVSNIGDIYSFFMINNDHNIKISFDHL